MRRITASEIVWHAQHPPEHPEVDAARDAYWEFMGPRLIAAMLPPDLSRLWDGVALWVALVAVSEAGYPWPTWMREYRISSD